MKITSQNGSKPPLQLWYSKDYQIFPSTIFNQAHNRKPNSEHRQPGNQLHNTQTAVQKFVFKYSMERRRYILQNISYK
jgi:hypothetical protein